MASAPATEPTSDLLTDMRMCGVHGSMPARYSSASSEPACQTAQPSVPVVAMTSETVRCG